MDGLGEEGEITIKHDFRYISKNDPAVKEAYANLVNMQHELQNVLRGTFTFQFTPVGSYKRNMITRDVKSNVGFDFDFNIEVNDNGLTAAQTKMKLQEAMNRVVTKYGYDYPENSTRVLTIKKKDRKNCQIIHSCDFAIVNNYVDDDGNECQEYIRFNKKNNTYSWCEQPDGYYMLPDKIEWVKQNGLWTDVRNLYLDLKNKNDNPDVHSRTIFAITVHQICQKNGFFDE